MIAAALAALSDILRPEFRAVLWKSIGLTVVLLIAVWFGLQGLLLWLVDTGGWPWLETVIAILTGIGLVIGLGLLVAPVAALFAGLFTDEIAGLVERQHYPQDPPGRDLPFAQSVLGTLAFTLVVIGVNLVCLILLLVPGVNLVAFLIGNGYLLGREYFEAAAVRFRPREEAKALRRKEGGTVFLAGLVIGLFVAIPIVNLATPLFATAFMVHLHKRLTGSRPVAV